MLLSAAIARCLLPAAAFADSYGYVALCCNTPGSVSTFNTNSNTFGPSIRVEAGAVAAARTPSGSELWAVTAQTNGAAPGVNGISIVDLQTGTTGSILLTFEPTGIVFNATGTLAYVTGYHVTETSEISVVAIVSVPDRKIVDQKAPPGLYAAGNPPIAISPDGSTLYLGTPASVQVLNAQSLTLTASIPLPKLTDDTPNPILNMAGSVLLVDLSGQLSVIDTSTNIITNSLATGNLAAMASNAGGTDLYLATTVSDSVSNPSALIQSLSLPSLNVTNSSTVSIVPYGLTLSPDGSKLVTASFPIAVIDAVSLAAINQAYAIDTPVSVQFGPTSDLVYATFTYPGAVSVIDQDNGMPADTIAVGQNPISVVTDSRENLIYVSTSLSISVIDPRSQTVIGTVPFSNAEQDSPGEKIAVAGQQFYGVSNQSLASYNRSTRLTSFLPVPHTGADRVTTYYDLAVSPDKAFLYATFVAFPYSASSRRGDIHSPSGYYSGLAIYDTSTNSLIAQSNVPDGGSIIFSSDSSNAYVAGQSGSEAAIYVLDNRTRTIATQWSFPQDQYFFALCISPDSSTIYALDGSNVYTINSASGQQMQTFPVPAGYPVADMALSPDGATLFLSSVEYIGESFGENAFVMDAATGTVRTINYTPNVTYGVAAAK